jgi:hypothetical protein
MSDRAERNKVEDSSKSIQKAVNSAVEGGSAAIAFASSTAEAVKHKARARIASAEQSARDAADQLADSAPAAARLVQTSAEVADRLSAKLQDRSLSDFTDSVGGFAARQPALFVGCGLLAGFLIAQLLPSSR